MCLNCKVIVQESCVMVPRWRIFGDFLGPAFPASRVQQVSDLHTKFAQRPGHTICASMVDIHSATAEIRRGKKEERKKKPQDENIMVCPITQKDHNNKREDKR